MLDELEALFAHQVRDVLRVPRDEVVEPDYRVAVRQKPVAEVRAEEACGARDEYSHAGTPPRPNEK